MSLTGLSSRISPVISIASITYDIGSFVFTLSTDGKLKVWTSKKLVKAMDIFNAKLNEGNEKLMLPSNTGKYIKVFDIESQDPTHPMFNGESITFKLMVFLNVPEHPEFVIFAGKFGNEQFNLEVIQRIQSNNSVNMSLIDFALSPKEENPNIFNCWTLWSDIENASGKVYNFQIVLLKSAKCITSKRWILAKTSFTESIDLVNEYENFECMDLQFLSYICESNRFNPELFEKIVPNYDYSQPLSTQIQKYIAHKAEKRSMDIPYKSQEFFNSASTNIKNAWIQFLEDLLSEYRHLNAPSSISFIDKMGCAIISRRYRTVGILRKPDFSEFFTAPLANYLNMVPYRSLDTFENDNEIRSHARDVMQFIRSANYIKESAIQSANLHELKQTILFDKGIHDLDVSMLLSQISANYFEYPEDINLVKFESFFNKIKDPMGSLNWLLNSLTQNDDDMNIDSNLSPVSIPPEILQSCFEDVMKCRHKLMISIFIVLVYTNSMVSNVFKFSAEIISKVFKQLLLYSKLEWISKQNYVEFKADYASESGLGLASEDTCVDSKSFNSVVGRIFHNRIKMDSQRHYNYYEGIVFVSLDFLRQLNINETWTNFCEILIEFRQNNLALKILESLTPSSEHMMLLGKIYLALKNYDKSRVSFERALNLDPERIVSYCVNEGIDDLVVYFSKIVYAESPNIYLMKILFEHCIRINDCEGAYSALMATPEDS